MDRLKGATLLPVVMLTMAGCGARTSATISARVTPRALATLIAVGTPLPPRPIEVMGVPGTAEVRVEDPARPAAPPFVVTLGRAVAREPRDVCFGTYVTNESPEDGDIGCQVRGTVPVVLSLGDAYIPHSSPLARFTVVSGQVDRDVERVELIGPGAMRTRLPLSAHRVFLVAFAPSARGPVRLVLERAHRPPFTHAFTLPLSDQDRGAWPRVRRRGAVFDYGIGENIVSQSYREIIRQFGPPLRTFSRPHGVRCIYYDVVGYENGWLFCFRGEGMVGASGNQPPPAHAGYRPTARPVLEDGGNHPLSSKGPRR